LALEVAHVARDSDPTFKVKRTKVKVTGGGGILWRPPTQLVSGISLSVIKRPMSVKKLCGMDRKAR